MVTVENAHEHYAAMPELTLYHMASNDSTRPEFKKVAVELMLKKGYKSAYKPEFKDILASILESIDLSDISDPMLDAVPEIVQHSGALSASITTESLNSESVIFNIPVEEVQKMDEPTVIEPANEAATSLQPSI